MNRQQLAHVLRAACAVTGDPDVIILGSQSILGTYGEIGELSDFHARNGYYPEGISLDTASLPDGWQNRVHGWSLASAYPANASFLDKHDLVVSKLVAFRDKDREFVASLIEVGLVEIRIIRERTALLPDKVTPVALQRILSWLDSFGPIR